MYIILRCMCTLCSIYIYECIARIYIVYMNAYLYILIIYNVRYNSREWDKGADVQRSRLERTIAHT